MIKNEYNAYLHSMNSLDQINDHCVHLRMLTLIQLKPSSSSSLSTQLTSLPPNLDSLSVNVIRGQLI